MSDFRKPMKKPALEILPVVDFLAPIKNVTESDDDLDTSIGRNGVQVRFCLTALNCLLCTGRGKLTNCACLADVKQKPSYQFSSGYVRSLRQPADIRVSRK